jgi:3-oxoacyl-[acyl-carrier protein] reductase
LSSADTSPGPLALKDKVVIVTGAATGIGKGIAARLAADGAAVVVNHLQQQVAEAEAVVAGIREKGGGSAATAADISRRGQFAALFARAEETFGKVDVLVNNAAVAPLTAIEEATDEQIEAVVAVNIKGTLYGCQLAAQRLADSGRIINISSSTTGLALPGYGIYDMTKARSSS